MTKTVSGGLPQQAPANPYLSMEALVQAQTAVCRESLNLDQCLNLREKTIGSLIESLFNASSIWPPFFDIRFSATKLFLTIPSEHIYVPNKRKVTREPSNIDLACISNHADLEFACFLSEVRASGKEKGLVIPLYKIAKEQGKPVRERFHVPNDATYTEWPNRPLEIEEYVKNIAPRVGKVVKEKDFAKERIPKKDLTTLMFMTTLTGTFAVMFLLGTCVKVSDCLRG